MKTFTVKVVGSRRSRTVTGGDWVTLDTVWLSEKCWYGTGTQVEISDESGNSKVFTKENLEGIAAAMPGMN